MLKINGINKIQESKQVKWGLEQEVETSGPDPPPLGTDRLKRDTPTQGHLLKTWIGNCLT